MGLINRPWHRRACIKFAHAPLDAISPQGAVCSISPQLWRLACCFKTEIGFSEAEL